MLKFTMPEFQRLVREAHPRACCVKGGQRFIVTREPGGRAIGSGASPREAWLRSVVVLVKAG